MRFPQRFFFYPHLDGRWRPMPLGETLYRGMAAEAKRFDVVLSLHPPYPQGRSSDDEHEGGERKPNGRKAYML
jgi:hypothetical protein